MSAPFSTSKVQAASETQVGVSEYATTAEAQAGTATDKSVVPANLGNTVIGMGQTWQDVKASRVVGTTYTNTTGRPIMVSIAGYRNTTNLAWFVVDGVNVGDMAVYTPGGNRFRGVAVVPAGSTYYLTVQDTTTVTMWAELR